MAWGVLWRVADGAKPKWRLVRDGVVPVLYDTREEAREYIRRNFPKYSRRLFRPKAVRVGFTIYGGDLCR